MSSIKTRISLVFTSLLLAILCIVAALTYHYSHDELKNSISMQQTTLINSLAQQLDDHLYLVQDQLKRVAKSLDGTGSDSQKMLDVLYDQEDQLVFFDAGLVLVDANRKILVEYPYHSERVGTSLPAADESFQETIDSKKPFISSPFLTPGLGEPVISFTAPIFNGDGSIWAILVGRHKLWSGLFLSSIATTRIGQTGYLYIIDKDRDIVVHPDKTRVLERIKPGVNTGLERALTGFEGTLETTDPNGAKELSSFKRLKVAPWILCSSYPRQDAYKPLDAAVRYFLLIILGVSLLSIALIRYLMQRMTLPLLKLTEHVSSIGSKTAKGRFTTIESDDEIGQLATVFNAMFEKIDTQQEILEDDRSFVENLVMGSAVPTFVLDHNHRIIYWNSALEKLTEYQAQEMIGTDRHWEPFYKERRPALADVVLKEDAERLPSLFANYRPSKFIEGAYQAEGWYDFSTTGRHYLFFHASPIRNSSGKIVGVVETLEDLTEAKLIEERLDNQYRFLQEILDAIPNPVFYKDIQGVYIGCNKAFVNFLGRTAEEIVGLTVFDVLPEEQARLNDAQDRIIISGQGNVSYESYVRRYDGESRLVLQTKAAFSQPDGSVGGVVGVLVDITEQRLLDEQIHKLSQAVEQSTVSIVITDTAGAIEYVNPRFCQVTGYSFDEVVSQNPRILKSGGMGSESYIQLWQTIVSGREWRGEFHNRRKNGELYWEYASISPLMDKSGAIIGYLAVKEDITDRKATENALQRSQAELELKHQELVRLFDQVDLAKREWEETLDCLKDFVILTDSENKVRRCNRLLCDMTGKSFKDVLGQNWRELLIESGFTFTTFDGSRGELIHDLSKRLYDLNIYTIKDPASGAVAGYVVSLNDTTELRTMTEELQRTSRELSEAQHKVFQQEKMASIGQLAAGVAHEINNPMGFISSNLSTLDKYLERFREFIAAQDQLLASLARKEESERIASLRKKLKIDLILDDTNQLIAESLEGAGRVRTIVQDLKSFSRVDQAECSLVDINDCLESTINVAWNEIKYVAQLNRDYGLIPPLKCFPQQLNQVFLNLLVNAAQAMQGQGEITVRTWSENGSIFISVKDTGTGIPPEVVKRIFEPFFTTKEVGKGTGLGLSISYDIIRKHNGDISVDSEPGLGTTFTVRLPVSAEETITG